MFYTTCLFLISLLRIFGISSPSHSSSESMWQSLIALACDAFHSRRRRQPDEKMSALPSSFSHPAFRGRCNSQIFEICDFWEYATNAGLSAFVCSKLQVQFRLCISFSGNGFLFVIRLRFTVSPQSLPRWSDYQVASSLFWLSELINLL